MAEKKKNTKSSKITKARASQKKTSSARKKAQAQTPPTSHSASPKRSATYLLIILALLATLAILITHHYTTNWHKKGEIKKVAQPKQEHSLITKTIEDKSFKTDVQKLKIKEDQKKQPSSIQQNKIKVYFLRFDEKTERILLVPVIRKITGKASIEKAIAELIKGPNKAEKEKGISTALPSTVKLRGVFVKGSTAEIDFSDAIEKNAAGSILINRIDQIVYTATEIEGIQNVIIKINGKRKEVFGSDGLSIGGPLHRRQ